MSDSYYGRPIVKEPTWTWEIPVYFFAGGLGGASAALSLGARIAGQDKLARTSLYVGAAGDLVSPMLLISDLGRPERFLNMLRVFKVTSPMSVGSWVLVFSGGASSTAALLELLGVLKPIKLLAEIVCAAFGPPLATYTGALVANTAVPVWSEGRAKLPFVFGSSACASAGAASALLLHPGEAGPARRLACGGAVGELAAMRLMEHRLGPLGSASRRRAVQTGPRREADTGVEAVHRDRRRGSGLARGPEPGRRDRRQRADARRGDAAPLERLQGRPGVREGSALHGDPAARARPPAGLGGRNRLGGRPWQRRHARAGFVAAPTR
ncbi:MAG: NrfD/PsrC family molybdoenzyme membrane anchor subunit [Gaiellaceae bacterium]